MKPMPERILKITGRVIDEAKQYEVAGLRVEAHSGDAKESATVNKRGVFTITLDQSHHPHLFEESSSEIIFTLCVFKENARLKTLKIRRSQESLRRDPKGWRLETDIVLNTPVQNGHFIVKGTVCTADGLPFGSGFVRAFDRDLRSEEPLGESPLDSAGQYSIQYTADQFSRSEKGTADIVVRAYADGGPQLAASSILFNAPKSATVDLTIPAAMVQPLSEFEKIARAIGPLLSFVAIVDLEQNDKFQDITFLAGETGFTADRLTRFALAYRLNAACQIEPVFWYGLLATPFYQTTSTQSIADQLQVVLTAISSLDAGSVSKALTSAINQNLVPLSSKDKLAGWTTAFLAFVAKQVISNTGTSSLTSALNDAGISDAAMQEKIAALIQQNKGLTSDVVDALKKDTSFTPAEIDDLQTTFTIAELTQGNLSAALVLKKAAGINQPAQVRNIAKTSEADLVKLVHDHVTSGAIKLPVDITIPAAPGLIQAQPAEAYGQMVARQIREAFPTTAFLGGLQRATQNGGTTGLKQATLISSFLDAHTDFEFLNTSVDDYLKKNLNSDQASLAPNNDFTLELKAVQRTFKLAPTFEASNTLLSDNLHSAHQVYRMGKSQFVRKYSNSPGFTPDLASQAWNKAAETHSATLTIIGELKSLDGNGMPYVLLNNNQTLSTFPNWNNLFSSGDMCECEYCRSVNSPAAYFADLLMFLKGRMAVNPANTVKDILFERRADLGFLELNCDNANTPIPYIDVVCEVLEEAIAPGANDLDLAGLTSIPDNSAATMATIAAAFKELKINLGDSFSLTQVGATDQWVAHGDLVTYLLMKKGGPDYFAHVLPNTKASAEELRANPQYVNANAYEKLKTAVYPLGLPFDLFNEEIRAAFQRVALNRWDLMETLRGTVAPTNPADGDIAAEYFDISIDQIATIDEKRIILNSDTNDQYKFWGETSDADMISNAAKVDVFMLRTGLEYIDLLALLDLQFINPAGDIAIVSLDTTCDTSQKVIQVLDAARFDRIHRFLRLFRKLRGWKMWELDLVIRHPSIGNGSLDEPFLVNLMNFCQVKDSLGAKATVEQVCSLFGNINIETHFTKPFSTRTDGLYQNLFLNKRLIHPLDTAFVIDPPATDLATGQAISMHEPVVQAALGIRQADLLLLKNLTRPSNGLPYITDDLNLANLSFLYRHAWLSKMLKFKVQDWVTLLKLVNQDVPIFDSPKTAVAVLKKLSWLKNCGFTMDELDWLLSANLLAKAATKEQDASKFLLNLRKSLQGIQSQYDPSQYNFLEADPPTDEDQLTALLTTILQQLGSDDPGAAFFVDTLNGDVVVKTTVAGLPAGFTFPTGYALPVSYNEPLQTLSFTGVMTVAQQTQLKTDPALAAVTVIPAYLAAIDDLYSQPRLAVKFYEAIFTAPLNDLPTAVDFKTQLSADLSAKISYDPIQLILQFTGIMSSSDLTAINALSADAAYLAAVKSLYDQPRAIAPPDNRIWLLDVDLDTSVPANDTFAKRLKNAILKALAYLLKTESENAVVQQCSDGLGLTTTMVREILTSFTVISPDNILQFFTLDFSTTSGAVDYASLKNAFDAWYWLNRLALILNRWKTTQEEYDILIEIIPAAQLLDFATLPIDQTKPVASLQNFLRACRLLTLRDGWPETEITFLEILEKLNNGTYPSGVEFGEDVVLMNDAWDASEINKLTLALDVQFPKDYLLAETWERLSSALGYLANLNAGTDAVVVFANPTVGQTESNALKQLLCSKFGAETWLSVSTDIQDALRQRKRDGLAAWLLYDFAPASPPSGKWEDTDDVYAYYLLDVEMCSCFLTSRLVQGSGSIQLFVQRCFMGLEPDVVVQTDGDTGDSAWLWWEWMSKYRVWEANRKIFLYPENWLAPELRTDKSQFFADLENELLQNDVTTDSVETAFLNYLDKLDAVAQLEIAGFYQEDDAQNTILHVFGRTKGGEPHVYYYRQYDYTRWTPWEKVDLDITGDYLVPAVVGKRLYLFWPIFTETQDEAANKSLTTPALSSQTTLPDTHKRLQLQMAASVYKQGKWTPKIVSKDVYETPSYVGEVIKNNYVFKAIDRTDVDGRFGIMFSGHSEPKFPLFDGDTSRAEINGSFELGGCNGGLILSDFSVNAQPVLTPYEVESDPNLLEWVELQDRTDAPIDDFALFDNFGAPSAPGATYVQSGLTPILMQTPDIFRVSPPWQLSWLDRLWSDIPRQVDRDGMPSGSWLPFFYADKKRTFFVLPSIELQGVRNYYPDVKQTYMQLQDLYEGWTQTFLAQIKLSSLSPAERMALEQYLKQQFPDVDEQPPYTDAQVLALLNRLIMSYFDYMLGNLSLYEFQFRQFHFKNDYHPFVCNFISLINDPLKGIPALMSRDTQLMNSGFSFQNIYQPTAWVVDDVPIVPPNEGSYPVEDVDFTPDGAYSPYNWELFYHTPLLIANSLSNNQQFEEAMSWYQYIFNPVGVASTIPGGSAMSKYWITKPFYLTTDADYLQQRIDTIMNMLAGNTTSPGYTAQLKKDLENQVLDWRNHPFDPDRIAQYRTVAYQKATVMKYLDNLIAWGDYLFAQDSMESINEATQLYVLAAEILGPKPKVIPPQVKPPLETFNELENQLDSFSNALIQVENVVPPMPGNDSGGDTAPLPTLYFCIPQNDQLLGYWDTVADRLYKIRHCMNIDGVVQQLALFEAPIDPGALVKAVAGGMDLSSALADMAAPLPLYRFDTLVQRANEVCGDVKALGGALLSALEKKDAEALNLLRQSQETNLLQAVKATKEQQLAEAKQSLDGIQKSRLVTEARRDYYRDIQRISTQEQLYLDKMNQAHKYSESAQGAKLGASVLSVIPAIDLGATGFGGSPVAKFKIGGLELGQAANLAAEVLSFLSQIASDDASTASAKGGYDRRWNDWKLQELLADKELDQLDSQIASAELRIAIAQQELDNQSLQIDNSKAIDAFMHSKYTNLDLYQWQVGQISSVYFQSYKLAYDLAKRAERCFRFEMGLQDSSFINFGYWDSLKKGLLSGENLQYDIRRLENAYLEHNRREFELTKHISLLMLDPLALVTLRETGRCFFSLPEEIFDLDYPGHYFRRIKSVSLTLPCVVGPYTTISCTLRLSKNSIRINTANGDNGYPRNTDDQGLATDDPRFIENNIPVNAIAASGGQNDSGVFELNFRDERYLPFERAGAIGDWSLELFNDLAANNPDTAHPDYGRPLRQFDYNTITDAVIHIKYTAREDAGPFKNGAIPHLRDYFSQDDSTNSQRLFNLKQEFPSQWYRFLNPTVPPNGNVFELEMSPGLFPFRDQNKTLTINSITVLARCTNAASYAVVFDPPLPPPNPPSPPAGSDTMTLTPIDQFGGLHFAQQDVSALSIQVSPTDPPVVWKLSMTHPGGGNLQQDPVTKIMEVEEMLLVLGYDWS